MKAAFIRQPGPPESIVYGDMPAPAPAGGQVLVRVKAVAVNPIDTYIRAGVVAMPLPVPFVVGCDLAGVVEAVGPGAARFRVGDRVWGSNQGMLGRQGTFAELAAVDEAWLHPIPPGVADEQTAALALVGITAHLGLTRHARLRPGETLFVHGGSGGVGSAVVQMGKALGGRVIATAGSAGNAEACRQLGADAVIRYADEDVPAVVRRLAPDGVDVWWETRREPDLEEAVPLLARRGRLVMMAGREARAVLPVGPFYVKDCSLHGFAMFNAGPEEQRPSAEAIARWLVEGVLRARIDRVLPLREAAAAHRLQEDNTLRRAGTLSGKIVLRP
ncbi:MAG: NADPH:quinone reductase [Verrucomicrobia bacterium]|nr:NADPH:quinone reductase [Verrucomicrobiota bacterium]